MSADLTCKRCNGGGKVYAADVGEWIDQGCPDCNSSGRRRPYLAEWDALKAERDQAKEAVRNIDKALRNAVKERNDALDGRDRYREALEEASEHPCTGGGWCASCTARAALGGGT